MRIFLIKVLKNGIPKKDDYNDFILLYSDSKD